MTVRRFKNRVAAFSPARSIRLWLVLAAIFCCMLPGPSSAEQAPAADKMVAESGKVSATTQLSEQNDEAVVGTDARLSKIEESLNQMRRTVSMAETRSYANKMMASQLIVLVKAILFALIFIAVSFPLTIWLISRKRLLGLSGLSDEVAATILVVEERQAKLVNILKEIQSEVEYLHSSAGPDFKNLIEQAEKYLEQNKRDLERAGTKG
jgi:hypothetical protein